MRIRNFLSRLRDDESGAVLVEFSLWTVLFFLVALGGLDFGAFFLQRGAANEAVSAAGVAAFSKRSNVNFTDIPAYVRTLANDQALTVTTSCNGTNASCTNLSRACSCLRTDGTFVAKVCGTPCTDAKMTAGSTAGYYFTVTASKPYVPMVLPGGTFTPKILKQSATVRLE